MNYPANLKFLKMKKLKLIFFLSQISFFLNARVYDTLSPKEKILVDTLALSSFESRMQKFHESHSSADASTRSTDRPHYSNTTSQTTSRTSSRQSSTTGLQLNAYDRVSPTSKISHPSSRPSSSASNSTSSRSPGNSVRISSGSSTPRSSISIKNDSSQGKMHKPTLMIERRKNLSSDSTSSKISNNSVENQTFKTQAIIDRQLNEQSFSADKKKTKNVLYRLNQEHSVSEYMANSELNNIRKLESNERKNLKTEENKERLDMQQNLRLKISNNNMEKARILAQRARKAVVAKAIEAIEADALKPEKVLFSQEEESRQKIALDQDKDFKELKNLEENARGILEKNAKNINDFFTQEKINRKHIKTIRDKELEEIKDKGHYKAIEEQREAIKQAKMEKVKEDIDKENQNMTEEEWKEIIEEGEKINKDEEEHNRKIKTAHQKIADFHNKLNNKSLDELNLLLKNETLLNALAKEKTKITLELQKAESENANLHPDPDLEEEVKKSLKQEINHLINLKEAQEENKKNAIMYHEKLIAQQEALKKDRLQTEKEDRELELELEQTELEQEEKSARKKIENDAQSNLHNKDFFKYIKGIKVIKKAVKKDDPTIFSEYNISSVRENEAEARKYISSEQQNEFETIKQKYEQFLSKKETENNSNQQFPLARLKPRNISSSSSKTTQNLEKEDEKKAESAKLDAKVSERQALRKANLKEQENLKLMQLNSFLNEFQLSKIIDAKSLNEITSSKRNRDPLSIILEIQKKISSKNIKKEEEKKLNDLIEALEKDLSNESEKMKLARAIISFTEEKNAFQIPMYIFYLLEQKGLIKKSNFFEKHKGKTATLPEGFFGRDRKIFSINFIKDLIDSVNLHHSLFAQKQ